MMIKMAAPPPVLNRIVAIVYSFNKNDTVRTVFKSSLRNGHDVPLCRTVSFLTSCNIELYRSVALYKIDLNNYIISWMC